MWHEEVSHVNWFLSDLRFSFVIEAAVENKRVPET